jgi:hypothetical protein
MTGYKFTDGLPLFASDSLGVTPPLTFRGVSARFFPLRANLDILQQLCDNYLNMIPPEAGRFRAFLPYVYLVVLDYGQMGESVMRTGWFSQVEVYFGVAVEWYKRVRGQWVFHDWGVITPYIFVNDDVSVPIGRTVYGFPKVLASVELSKSPWMKNPVGPSTLARISTTVFPEAYTGASLQNRVFLEIERATVSNVRVPFDTTTAPMPWSIASNIANAVGGFGRDALWMAQSMRIFPINPLMSPGVLPAMLSRTMPWMAPGGAGFILNSLNVKQFRRAENPSQICYRALTNGCMQTTGFNRAGLLGEGQTLLGDLSGGHTIRLYEHSTLPIAQTLGLEQNRSVHVEGLQVAEFKPVMPFWVDVDLKFSRGTNVAWQTDDGVWKNEEGVAFDGVPHPNPPFNSTISTAIEAIAGPFQFCGTTVRVIPLLADKKTLQKFVNESLNKPLKGRILQENGKPSEYKVRFKVWARRKQAINPGIAFGGNFAYVYLTASSFGNVISESDNVGDWAQYELTFMIPVKWQRMKSADAGTQDDKPADEDDDGSWETIGVGLVPAFTLADNCITAISRLEIQGIASTTANFIRPESVWLGEEDQGNPRQTLLRVNVELLSALGAGQQAAFQPVIEIIKNDPNLGLGTAPDRPGHWAEDLRHELGQKKAVKQQYFQEMKVARALALELLGNKTPFSIYTLKQFRDVSDPNKACYQSIVRVPRVLTEVFDMREIEDTLAVNLYGYPSMNLVQSLGLEHTRLDDATAGIAYSLQALRPFYIRTTLSEPLGERMIWRAGRSDWTLDPAAFKTLLAEPNSRQLADRKASPFTVDLKAETLQDQMDPSRTAETMFQATQRRIAEAVPEWEDISVKQARAAFEVIDPQTVIESILSREWSNFDPEARWRKGHQTLLQNLALPQGGPLKPYAEAELYRQMNNMMAAKPGAVAAHIGSTALEQPGDTSTSDGNSGANPPSNRPSVDKAPPDASPSLLRYLTKASHWEILSMADPLPEKDPLKQWLEQLASLKPDEAFARLNADYETIERQNLFGQGGADRWRQQVKDILLSQRDFTTDRIKLEESLDVVSPVKIIGYDEMKTQFAAINKERKPEEMLKVPDESTLFQAGRTLIETLNLIAQRGVKGEPSPHNNLDTVALADEVRLKDMLDTLDNELKDEEQTGASKLDKLVKGGEAHAEEVAQMVLLARAKCMVQFEALLFKLSRGFQKPDFCLRRDALKPGDRDRLLPLSLAWNEDWYYGDVITLDESLAKALPPVASGETQPRPAASTPEAES